MPCGAETDMLGVCLKKGLTMKQNFIVEGMSCGHCEKAVTQAVLTVDPQARVIIDRSQNTVSVESDQSRERLREAMAEEGYRVLV